MPKQEPNFFNISIHQFERLRFALQVELLSETNIVAKKCMFLFDRKYVNIASDC